jgi:hypothetical protein
MTQAFNLSQLANNVDTSGKLNAAAGLYNQTPVANGGTGVASVASGNLLIGAGTSAMTALAGAATNDVVTWNGTAWISQAGAGGAAPVVTIYAAPATWTKPASIKAVKVTVFSGGGGGAGSRNRSLPAQPQAGGGGGGAGGFGFFPAASIPGPVSLTVGTAGAGGTVPGTPATVNAGTSGGASSFGAFITATGGAAAPGAGNGAPTPGGAAGAFTPSPTQIGRPGVAGSAGSASTSGTGGNSFQLWGFGGNGTASNSTPGGAGSGYGGGGGGGCTSSPSGGTASGGAGAVGYVIVEEFY